MVSSLRLVWSSLKIIREEGPGKFLRLLTGWMRGKRGQYHPDVPLPPVDYDDYWRRIAFTLEDVQRAVSTQLEHQPFFLILTPATQYEIFYHSIVSVLYQIYPQWAWMVAVQPSHPDYFRFASLAKDYPRIWLVDTLDVFPSDDVYRMESAHVRVYQDNVEVKNLPEHPDYVLFLEEGDQLALEALFMLAEAINRTDAGILYSDYDYLDPDVQSSRHFIDPVFKPDWSPELMLSFNLLGHLGCYRWEIWQQFGSRIDTWDFVLKASKNQSVVHIPRVLYHRRHQHRAADFLPDMAAIIDHLKQLGLHEPVVGLDIHNVVKVTWVLSRVQKVSIIIPSKDQPALLERCLSTLFSLTNYPDFEVFVVDTGSSELETFELYDRYKDDPRFQKIDYTGEFNFSRACNLGVEQSDGELLLFLNNDTEIIHPDWLQLIVQWFELPDVGIVGTKLLYPDNKIQHAGVIIGLHGLAAHIFAMMDEHRMTMFGSDDWYRNYMAVTGACLMIPRRVFNEVGGFDEAYKLNYSDVALCIAVYQAGYRIIYTPHVRLIHHESATHKKQIPVEDTLLFNERLQSLLDQGDCYYNPNLTHQSQIPYPRRDDQDTAFRHNKIMMAKVKQVLQSES